MAEQVLPTIQDSGPLPLPKFEEGLGAALIQLYSGSGPSASPSSTSTTPSVVTKGNSGIGGGPPRISSSSGGSNNNNNNINNNNNNISGSASNSSSSSNVLTSHPNFKMGIGRRESPLDLSVKTVRQSADSSTSSLVGIDGLSNYVGSNSGSVMNRSMSASRSSTPNTQNSVVNHMGGRDSGGSANSVIAAPANSTTSSVKDFPGTTPPSVIADGGKLAGSSASSTTGGDNLGRKSKKNSSGVASPANSGSTNTISSSPHVSTNQTNGISNPGTPNLNNSHHLFGHHSLHQPHSIHAMHASPRPVLPYNTNQPNHHGNNHSGPSGTSLNIPSSSLAPHHSIQAPIQHQQAGQSQRPSSVIPPYHPHPPNVAPPMSPYHHQYNSPAPHHYHHGYNAQYYPHFPNHPQNASSHPVGSTNGPPSQTHLNYFSPYTAHCPPPPSSQGQPVTPTSVPSTTQRDLNQSGSHSSSNNSSKQSQAATVSSTVASIQTHAQMNYPTSKSIPPPMTSHYTPNSSAATQSPHPAYGAYAHSITAPGMSSHSGQPGQYYQPGVQPPRPQLEPTLSAQNLHQPHYPSHPNHASHHYSQPFGHYASQGYGYHHPHNPNNVLPSHTPQNVVSSNQNPTKVPPPTAPVHGYGDRSTPKSLPSAHNSASISGPPNFAGTPSAPPANSSSAGPEPDRNVHSKGPNSNPVNQTKPNGGTISAPKSVAPQGPSGKTKGGGTRGGGREGKTSSRKNLLNILRNSCESRIHEKQEKEKFQFHHQTWNFQGRKFNTVLPPAGGSSGGSSNSSSVNHHSFGLNIAEGKNNLASSSPISSMSASSTAKIGTALDPTSSSASLHMKTERDSFQFSAFNAEALSSGDASSSFHTLNRIRTKAEKKQLFPNLLSQIEQENSSREKASKSSGGNAGSRIGSHAGRGNDKAAVSVFDFEDDEEDKTTVKPAKAIKKSPAKGRGSSKKENAGSASPTKIVPKDDNSTAAVSKPNSQTGAPLTTLTSSAVNVSLSVGVSESTSAFIPAPVQIEVKADAADGFWAVCDSFLTDLASNPTTIKSRRGGLWQKLKSKSNPTKTAKSPGSKVKRALKNSSEEDSDFKVEEEEEKSEDKSDETSTEEDDDNSLKSSATADSKATNSKDSDEIPIVNRKRKQSRVIRDDEDSRDSSVKGVKNASKRRKMSPSTAPSPRKSTSNKKSKSGNNNNKSRTGRSKDRKNKSPVSKTRRSSRRSGRNSGRDLSVSDLDDENNSDRTSIASENSEESDSSHSFSIDSYNSESENSNTSSDSDDSESYSNSDSDEDESDSDINSQSSSSGRKRRRAATKGNKKKVLRSSTKSLRSSTKRSTTGKNKKSKDKKRKKKQALRLKRKSLRKRNLRNLNLRPKRNCATPGSKGRLKDISGESEEEVQNEGSSGEEWIMRGELGKKKRRIVFGDGSDFNNPNWEEELIDYKKNLRMPSKLIRVPKPSSLTKSVICGNSSTASSICNSKDVDCDVSKHESVSKQNEKGADTKKKSKAKVLKSPTKSETKSLSAITPSKSKGKSKEEKQFPDAGIVVTEEKGIKLRDKSLREKPKTPEKSPNKTTNKKEPQEKEAKKTVSEPSMGKNTNGDRYAKLAKEKEAQMLPTPGASGSKFTKKMSIKSVFGVDITAPSIEADKSTKPTIACETENGTPAAIESPVPVPPKKISRRNKFKSGFDYIRKKKKVTATPDGTVAQVLPKRVKTIEKELNEEDVVAEMRGWVLRKELGETILHRAARLGYPDVASYCLEHDLVSPNSKDNAGYTPLHETCIKGNLEVAKVILAYGANPSQAAPGGIRPLHEACENGHVELVRLLISYGADPLLATYAGQSPIELAEPHEAVRLLLQEHIKDLQGKQETPWVFRGSGPWADSPYDNGFEVTDCAPSPEEPIDPDAFEFEASENCLPPLYRLKGEVSFYILLQDLLNYLGQPKERFMKNNPNADVVELNSNDFLEQAHCCHLLGEKFNLNSSSDLLTLIKYDDHVKKMLNIESCFIK